MIDIPTTITTAAQTYTPPSGSIVLPSKTYFGQRGEYEPVPLVQYDDTLPIIAVTLYLNGQPYTVPDGAAVNVRMAKGDGTYVYNPALGVSEDRQTAYIAVTYQMTVIAGSYCPILELVVSGDVAGTSELPLQIAENPVPEDAIASTDEYKTIQQLAVEVQEAAAIITENEQAIQDIEDNLDAIQGAAGNAQSAAANATLAQSWAVGGTDTRAGEDTNNAQYWAEQAQEAAASAEGPLIGTTSTVTPEQVYDALQQRRLVVLTSTYSNATYSNFSVGYPPYIYAMAPKAYNSDGSFRMRWLEGNFDGGGWSNDYTIDGALLDSVNTSDNGKIPYVEGGNWTFQSIKSLLLDMVYPVGSIYISYSQSTSPAALFGGSWMRIQGRFLLAADSTHAAGSTGGEAEHTLTQNEMPAHTHGPGTLNITGGFGPIDDGNNPVWDGAFFKGEAMPYDATSNSSGDGYKVEFDAQIGDAWSGQTATTGRGQPHNNMPPYLAVYMWRRIS